MKGALGGPLAKTAAGGAAGPFLKEELKPGDRVDCSLEKLGGLSFTLT